MSIVSHSGKKELVLQKIPKNITDRFTHNERRLIDIVGIVLVFFGLLSLLGDPTAPCWPFC